MITLRKVGSCLVILINDTITVYNFENKSRKFIKIQEPLLRSNLTKSLKDVLKPENRRATSFCISKNAEYFAVTLQNRQLVIYDGEFNIVVNIMTKRAVSKSRFTTRNDLIIADKTGDVYLYEMNGNNKEPELLLGHLSMLLDVVVSECGKYVMTCDRDEKIRVSRYPNAYNIVSYCLGHQEFVNNLEVSGEILMSTSGDGTIRFWNFLTGRQLLIINTNEHVEDKRAIEKFCEKMDQEKVDIGAIPVTQMQVFQNFLGVTLLGCNGVQLYCVETQDGNLTARFLENIAAHAEVISFSFAGELFILTRTEVLIYSVNADGCEKVNSEELDMFHASCKGFLLQNDKVAASDDISALYKRKFDNVQDYLEKKRLRLENKS